MPRSEKPPRGTARELLNQIQPLLDGSTGLDAAERIARPSGKMKRFLDESGADPARLIVDLYESHFSATSERKAGGVFYTPPHIVESMLERLPDTGDWLDPAAGAGAFLVAFVRKYGAASLSRLHACDVDPHALNAAALALEAALGADARKSIERWRQTKAHVADFLQTDTMPQYDVIVGNPPYGIVSDDRLAKRFPVLRGETDLYACFLVRALEAVRPNGIVSLLVPDTWLTNTRAARLREVLAMRGVTRILDFGKPFTAARDTRVHAVMLQTGAVECQVESVRDGRMVPLAPAPQATLVAHARKGWRLYRTREESRACRQIERGRRLGDVFDVLYGLRTGNNGLHVRSGAGVVPLVGGRDLDAYDRRVDPKHLADPAAFRSVVSRQVGRMKLGVQRIRTNSKLPWRRWVEVAPLTPEEVGLDSLTLIAELPFLNRRNDDALWALMGVLNSSILNRWYRLTFTDVNVKPAYLSEVPIPEFPPVLAGLVKERVRTGADLLLERTINQVVADAYGLEPDHTECLEKGFWGDRWQEFPIPSRIRVLPQGKAVAAEG